MGLPDDYNMNKNQEVILELPYPAQTKQAVAAVNGLLTDVMVISFSDKIMVTITQEGRLAHWVCLHRLFTTVCSHLTVCVGPPPTYR